MSYGSSWYEKRSRAVNFTWPSMNLNSSSEVGEIMTPLVSNSE